MKRLLKTFRDSPNENWTVDIGNTHQLEVPASFGVILKECTSREDFIDKALEVREENHFRKFRSKVIELDNATKSGDPTKANNIVKESREIFQGIKKYESFPYDSLIVIVLPFIKLLAGAPPNLIDEITSVGSIYSAIRGVMYYIKKRRLQYLHNIKKRFDQTININEQLLDKFGTNLTQNELNYARERMKA